MAGCGLAACGGSGATPTHWATEKTFSSADFVYHARPDDDSVDPEVLDVLERNRSLVATGWLGLPADGRGPIEYFKYRNDDDLVAARSACGDRACTLLFDNGRVEVHSSLAVDPHELVHGYTVPVACAPPMLREGLAVSVACQPASEPPSDGALHAPAALPASWRALTDFEGPQPTSYVPAGELVTWLVDQWGAARFFDLYRAADCHAGQDQLAAAFAARYGMTLDDAWTAFVAAPRRRPCLFLWGCAEESPTAADVLLTNQPVGYRLALPVDAGGAVVTARYSATSTPPVVRPCSPASAVSGVADLWPPLPDAWSPTVLLPGGPIAVGLRDADGTAADWRVSLTLSQASPAAPASGADACSGAAPVVVDDVGGTVLAWPRAAPLILALRSSVADPAQRAHLRHDGGADVMVEACSGCAAGSLEGCGDAERADEPSAFWLRITWSSTAVRPLAVSFEWL
jgi:hypothetical protein